MKRRKTLRLSKQLLSKNILRYFFDDLSIFGSIPFYWVFTLSLYFAGLVGLFYQFAFCFALSLIAVLSIKAVHFKERPQKQEFSIFMEKMIAASFPSTHSLNATVVALLVSINFQFMWVWILSGFLALCVYIQRYVAKKHFVIDVVGGILLGIVEVVVVVRLF